MKQALPLNQILTGNCLEVMKTFPEESIDFVMFSPPYWGLRNYGEATETVWGDGWKGQLGLEPSWRMYVEHMVEVCREVKRILKKSGSMWIVIGDTYAGSHCGKGDKMSLQNYRNTKVAEDLYEKPNHQAKTTDYKPKCLMGIPWRVAFALIDDGWILRNAIVWHKPNHMPASVKDRLTQTYEHIFFFVKSKKYYFDLDAIREPHKTAFAPFNLRVRDVKHGKGGVSAFEALKTSKEEIESYVYLKKYNTKYEKDEHGRTLQYSSRQQSIAERRRKSREEAKLLFPNDPKKQQEYINYVHDHDGHPLGKNPGDVFQIKKYPPNTPRELRLVAMEGVRHGEHTEKHIRPTHPLGKNPGDYWSISTKPFKGAHFAVMPEAICIKPILAGSPPKGVVLDPMCGSGTTCVVAKKLGRNYIGIEINPEYVRIANEGLAKVLVRIPKFF